MERAVSFYADDAVEIASNTPIAEGKEAIRRWYQTWLPDTTVAISFATDTVVVALSGELAYERGTWKVAADMANSDRPLPG